jgi:hypothetical protein
MSFIDAPPQSAIDFDQAPTTIPEYRISFRASSAIRDKASASLHSPPIRKGTAPATPTHIINADLGNSRDRCTVLEFKVQFSAAMR